MTDENQAQNSNERAYRLIEKHPLAALSIAAVVIFIMVVIYWAIWADSSPAWTGFGAYDEETAGPRAKTLWDWLGLLIVPVALAVGAYLLNRSQKETELKIAKKAREEDREIARQARETEQKIATDRQMQATLEAYYDRMTELLLERDLRGSESDSEVRSIARAHTVAAVKSLDAERNQQLFAFLKTSKLIDRDGAIIDLTSANFRDAKLEGIRLIEVDLSGSDMSGANLSETVIFWSNLNNVKLNGARLIGAEIEGAGFQKVCLDQADLSHAYLRESNFNGASFKNTILRGTSFDRSDLNEIDLELADLQDASLFRCSIKDAKKWTLGQLDQVQWFESVNMPDNAIVGIYDDSEFIYDEWKAQYLAKQNSG